MPTESEPSAWSSGMNGGVPNGGGVSGLRQAMGGQGSVLPGKGEGGVAPDGNGAFGANGMPEFPVDMKKAKSIQTLGDIGGLLSETKFHSP